MSTDELAKGLSLKFFVTVIVGMFSLGGVYTKLSISEDSHSIKIEANKQQMEKHYQELREGQKETNEKITTLKEGQARSDTAQNYTNQKVDRILTIIESRYTVGAIRSTDN